MADPTPTPQDDPYATIRLLLIIGVIWLVLSGGGIGGGAAPFVTDKPSVFVAFDDDAQATMKFDKEHPGQADVITSLADDSARTWVTKSQGGRWVNYGMRTPEPDPKMVDAWFIDAYKYWKDKGAGKVPYIVAAGPNKGGYAGDIPDTQEAAKKALAPIAK